jgi:hypothetical protein
MVQYARLHGASCGLRVERRSDRTGNAYLPGEASVKPGFVRLLDRNRPSSFVLGSYFDYEDDESEVRLRLTSCATFVFIRAWPNTEVAGAARRTRWRRCARR